MSINGEVIPSELRQNLTLIPPLEISKSRKTVICAKTMRGTLKEYFVRPGQLEWQWKLIN